MLFCLGETAKSQPREQDHHDDNADGGPDVNQCPWHDERPLTVSRLFRVLYMSRGRHRISYVQDLNASFAILWIWIMRMTAASNGRGEAWPKKEGDLDG